MSDDLDFSPGKPKPAAAPAKTIVIPPLKANAMNQNGCRSIETFRNPASATPAT